MRTIRIYQPGTYLIGQTYTLTQEASHHVATVLRMQKGAEFTIFCGDNQEYTALIEAVHKKNVTFTILAITTINRESPRNIHLAQGISKGDRMEWVVQKAVE
jgi:16S rRNA (uracil1498-N3)-methyltransferase